MTSLSPLLYPPPKKTEEVDFGPSFRAYIASAYGDEPEKYAAEIGLLNRLRDDTRGAGKDITGRDILYRYYGQLELLDLRFPIDEKHVKVLFTWSDAFTGKTVSQNAVAYEKACVIFSLAATCGAIAGSQERNDPHALKVAFNHLQAAAGLFAYINDNFLHPPSVDLSRESVKALETLMLAQAQELFVEKCLVENKQGQLVAKLSAQAALLYGNAKDALSDDALKQQINRAWIDMAKCKQNYFESLAHYHRSIQLESEGKYGHVVSHMLKADTLAKDAESLAKYFGRTYPSFTVAASNPQNSSLAILSALGASATPSASASPAGALIEMTKAFALKVLERKNSVVKDNDVIYHEPTPSVDTLPAIDKLAAAKGITFAELCPNGAADVPKIVGPDIFVKLVPLSVHTAASVYSEEQAKLLRGESAAVESADEELKVSLESMGIVASLDKLKRVLKGGSSGVQDVMGSDESLGLTEEVRGWCGTIRSQEIGRGTGTDELLGVIEGLKGKIKGTLDEIGLLLDKEQHECESMRVKYMNAWNQEPSVKLTNQIRYDVRSHRESFDQALATDQGLLARLNECRRDVATMSRPLDEVQSIFAELIRAVATLKKSDVAVGNLIDDVPGSEEGLGKLGEQITVEKLDGMIQQLRKLKNERATLLAELKTKVREDDISKALLLNKNKESQVFQAELAKFKPYQAKIKANVDTHSQLLVDIASEFEKLKNSSTTIKVLELRERRRNEIIKEWKESFVLWKEAKEGLNRGVRFYTDLSDLAQSLKNTVVGFVNRRGEESAALIKRIEAEEAMKGQRQLQNEMARLSVTASGPPPPQPYPSSYASPTVSSPSASSATRSSYPPAPVPAPVPQPTYSQPPPQPAYSAPPPQPQPQPQPQSFSTAQSPSYQTQPTTTSSTYGGAPTQYQPAQSNYGAASVPHQPVYGGAPAPQPIYGGAGSQPPQQQPVYGGASGPQVPQQPVYGGAPAPRPVAPSNPVFGGQPVYGGQPPQPTYGGQPQYSQARPAVPATPQQAYYGGAPQQPQYAQASQQPRPPPIPQQPSYGQVPGAQAQYGGQPHYSQGPGAPPPIPQKQGSFSAPGGYQPVSQSQPPYGQQPQPSYGSQANQYPQGYQQQQASYQQGYQQQQGQQQFPPQQQHQPYPPQGYPQQQQPPQQGYAPQPFGQGPPQQMYGQPPQQQQYGSR